MSGEACKHRGPCVHCARESKCSSSLYAGMQRFRCELPEGHEGKHSGHGFWSDMPPETWTSDEAERPL